jgi:quercetin dioxygenase-like cupin family protein
MLTITPFLWFDTQAEEAMNYYASIFPQAKVLCADNGDVNVSVFLLNALPGRGPGPHRHPYDEVQFVRSGSGRYVVNGEEFEAGAGDILVIKAGEVHEFKCIGDEPLVQVDVHLSPRFIQENLG